MNNEILLSAFSEPKERQISEPVTMLTILEAAKKYSIAVHALRIWVKSGELPAVRCGKKYLIADMRLRDFLLNGNNQTKPETAPQGKIRHIAI
jgi:excisionase family DNA binding protein